MTRLTAWLFHYFQEFSRFRTAPRFESFSLGILTVDGDPMDRLGSNILDFNSYGSVRLCAFTYMRASVQFATVVGSVRNRLLDDRTVQFMYFIRHKTPFGSVRFGSVT